MKKRHKFWAVIILGAVLGLALAPQAQALRLNKYALQDLSRCYLYLLVQQDELQRISAKFPELAPACLAALTKFQAKFPQITQKVEAQLGQAMGAEKFAKVKKTVQEQMRQVAAQQEPSQEKARNLLRNIAELLKGKIELPYLRYLPALQYEDAPVQEMRNGFYQPYTFEVPQIAPPMSLSLAMPSSWGPVKSEQDFIIQQWASENANGWERVVLNLDQINGGVVNDDQLKGWVESGKVTQYLPEGFTCHKYGLVKVGAKPGLWFEVSKTGQGPMGMKIYQRGLLAQFYFGDKAVSFYCAAPGLASQKQEIDADYQRLDPLCRQVVQSMRFKPGGKTRP